MMMMMTYTPDWTVTSTLLFLDWSFSSRWGSFASSLNRWEWGWWQGWCCDNDDDIGDTVVMMVMMVMIIVMMMVAKALRWWCLLLAAGVVAKQRGEIVLPRASKRERESGMGGWEWWLWWWWHYHHMLNIDDGITDRHYDDAHDHGRPRESGWWASWKAARLRIKTINVIIITVANIISGIYDKIPFNAGICS